MAKKKKKKEETPKSFKHSIDLISLLLILIGIIGFGTFGPVGKLIKNFAIFLMGSWYAVVLLAVLIIGLYMLFKRKPIAFFSNRMIGIYFLLVAILMFSHLEYAIINELEGRQILQATIDNFMGAASSLNSNVGGGIIGGLFVVLFTWLFDIAGTRISIFVLAIFGLILIFDITISDIYKKIAEIISKIKENRQKKIKEAQAQEEEPVYEEDEEFSTQEPKVADEVEVTQNLTSNQNIYLDAQPSLTNYQKPHLNLLDDPIKPKKVNSNEFTSSNQRVLERVLNDFGVKGEVKAIHTGPAVTQYEVAVPPGTRVSKISSLNKEIALALAAKDVRIQAPIPGRNTVGVEIPNPLISMVKIKEVLANVPKSQKNAKLLVALGKDIMGSPQTCDISKTPHLLVAGSTGSGKSVCINSFIISLLINYRPDEVRLVLIDPKKVELSNYNGIPHLLCPVVSNPKKASAALQRVVAEMEKRYDMFSEAEVKNISTYNEWIDKNHKNIPKMFYIVVIIDELADLMMVASKEVEDSIMRITQMARAAGIHLIVATQRPSTDVITGVVKANIPSRIAFAVATGIDSRTILDQIGAEKLLGKGDMLYLPMGENTPLRIQGTLITDDEIRRVISFVCKQQQANYDNFMNVEETNSLSSSDEKEEYDDPLYDEILNFAIESQKVSASLLQRRFRIGYNRAARVVDLLEERGIIGPANGSKPREVLIKNQNQEK